MVPTITRFSLACRFVLRLTNGSYRYLAVATERRQKQKVLSSLQNGTVPIEVHWPTSIKIIDITRTRGEFDGFSLCQQHLVGSSHWICSC